MNNDISIEQAVIAYLQFVKNTMSENTYRANKWLKPSQVDSHSRLVLLRFSKP